MSIIMDILNALDYEPNTGLFRWKVTVGRRGCAGNVAGCLQPTGYVVIIYKKKIYRAHRLAFLFMEGSMPPRDKEIDHIDGIRSNNAWENLRECSKHENQQNRKLDVDSTSGLLGACLIRGRWYSQISYMGKKYSLGYYDTKEQAHYAYLTKKKELHTFNPVPR